MHKKKNIVFVSISSDLYGSSKVLLTLILKIKATNEYHPIVCMPYEEGPLKNKLTEAGIEIVEMPILKLTRSMLNSLRFKPFYKEYKQAKTILNRHLNGREIHCVQSNTLATLFGSFYCFENKNYHLVHVHEIMDRPWFVRYLFSFWQLIFANKIVYNSTATATFYNNTIGSLKKKSVKIFNGIDRQSEITQTSEIKTLRDKYFKANKDDILIGLIGRFNRLKGHLLLLDAFTKVVKQHPNSHLCFIGSPPEGQEQFLEKIKLKIDEFKLKEKVTILPFQEDIYKIIDTLDIVIIPSTEPESFGIIAVEAMLSKKPVIATNIGGLFDIISHKETGLLFNEPYAENLTKMINKLIENPEMRQKLAEQGYLSAITKFGSQTMSEQFLKIYNTIY
jgi:glycosyltransferase involved in cell wall biosynthesis